MSRQKRSQSGKMIGEVPKSLHNFFKRFQQLLA